MAAIPPADGTEVANELRQMVARLSAVVARTLDGHDVAPDEARELLEEVSTAIEELTVAEEELVVQGEQLVASAAAVDAERERYGFLFESAPDAYLETDRFGKVLRANSAAETLLGVPRPFLVGKLLHAFLAAPHRRVLLRTIADLASGAPTATLEVDVTPRAGSPVPVEIHATGHVDAADEVETRILWLMRDITDRLKLESEIRQLHSDVELLAALAAVNRLVESSEDPVVPLLGRLARLAERIAPGGEAGVVLGDRHGGIDVRAVSSDAANELCAAQEAEEGPAVQTLRDGQPRLHATEELSPWPSVEAAMRRHGFEWALSHPIVMDGAPVGVFTIVGTGSRTNVERSVQLLADHAASAIANGALYRSTRDLASQLETALQSRGVIEQAKGVLMATQHCDADAAFEILRRASQRENRKLRVIAEEIVHRAVTRPPAARGD